MVLEAQVTGTVDLGELAEALSGCLVLPEDESFLWLRKAFLGRPEEILPRAVARCAGPGDVADAVRFAATDSLPLAVRSGGHSFADFCTTDGLLIDLGSLDSVEVDQDVVRVGPGVRLGALSKQLATHGLVLPCGWHPQVGVGGAVLGGGFGMLSRYYGLGCDHLIAAQVVLADGTIIWTDERQEPELFWALRGAGWGGLGVVTSLVLRAYPAPRTTTFAHHWPWQQAAEVINAWQRWAPHAPAPVNAELTLHSQPRADEPRLCLFGAVVGDVFQARPALEDFLRSAPRSGELEELTELSPSAGARRYTYAGMPVLDMQQSGPPTMTRVVKSEYFCRPVPAKALDTLVETFMQDRPDGQVRELEFIPWGGAIAQAPPAATAFANRTDTFQIGHHATVFAGDPDQDTSAREWVKRSWDSVHPWATGRVYPNYPDPDLTDWGTAYYGDNLPRLMQVKRLYDPENLFKFAQSIPLAGPLRCRRADGRPPP